MEKKCNAYQLKIFAMIFMIIEHIHTFLNIGPYWIGLFTRFVAPLFTFFIVEGFYKTSSRKKYFLRTFIFSLIMLAGNVLINLIFKVTDPVTNTMNFYSIVQGLNIFMTFAVFILLMMLIEKIKKKEKMVLSIFLFAILSLFSILFTEGGSVLYPILLIMYFFYGNKKKISLGISLVAIINFVIAFFNYRSGVTGTDFFRNMALYNDWANFLVIIPIFLYDGSRGKNTKFAKWFFYIIYPLHIWILYITSLLLNK